MVTDRYPIDGEQRETRRRSNRTAVAILVVALFIGWAWTQGTFDNFLWRVHLNYDECVSNAFGATFCGDAARRYEKLIGTP